MTVATSTNKAGPYSTNGSTTQFPFSFLVFQESDIVVYKTNISTMEINTLTLNTDYTVSGVDNTAGGYVQISPALATGYKITILRKLNIVQDADLSNQGGWFPNVHEKVFDKLTMVQQQQQEELDRTLKVGVGEDIPADYLGDAQRAAGLAALAKTGAETAQTAAETAMMDAQTAQAGAETAKTQAEAARDAAQNYYNAMTTNPAPLDEILAMN